MSANRLLIEGVEVPRFLYGTAWKEDNTQRLTELALRQGFHGIDTANQRRHYFEAAVGEAITRSIAGGSVKRNDLFLQTKFTFRGGQDHRLPYDPEATISVQVEQSFSSSLQPPPAQAIEFLLLCMVPLQRTGSKYDDWEAWRAMEGIHASGRVRLLGVSNVTLEQLQQLCEGARVRPRFVQNRCHASRGWDRAIRKYCSANGIVYQGFSLLTANREVMTSPEVIQIAKLHGRTTAQIVFRLAIDLGMIVLTGTTDAVHMREDLDVHDFRLEAKEVKQLEGLITGE